MGRPIITVPVSTPTHDPHGSPAVPVLISRTTTPDSELEVMIFLLIYHIIFLTFIITKIAET